MCKIPYRPASPQLGASAVQDCSPVPATDTTLTIVAVTLSAIVTLLIVLFFVAILVNRAMRRRRLKEDVRKQLEAQRLVQEAREEAEKKAEEAMHLSESRAMIERVLSAMAHSVVHLDANFRVSEPCPSLAALLLGSYSDTMLHKEFVPLLVPGDRERFESHMAMERDLSPEDSINLSAAPAAALHVRMLDAFQTTVSLQLFCSCILGSNGEPSFMVGIVEHGELGRQSIAEDGSQSLTVEDVITRRVPELEVSGSQSISSFPGDGLAEDAPSDSEASSVSGCSQNNRENLRLEFSNDYMITAADSGFDSFCGYQARGTNFTQLFKSPSEFIKWLSIAEVECFEYPHTKMFGPGIFLVNRRTRRGTTRRQYYQVMLEVTFTGDPNDPDADLRTFIVVLVARRKIRGLFGSPRYVDRKKVGRHRGKVNPHRSEEDLAVQFGFNLEFEIVSTTAAFDRFVGCRTVGSRTSALLENQQQFHQWLLDTIEAQVNFPSVAAFEHAVLSIEKDGQPQLCYASLAVTFPEALNLDTPGELENYILTAQVLPQVKL